MCLWVQLLRTAGMVLLQREIPEEVNARVAAIARAAQVPVLLDCGGVEGPISPDLLHSITTLSPNETELARLTGGALRSGIGSVAAAHSPCRLCLMRDAEAESVQEARMRAGEGVAAVKRRSLKLIWAQHDLVLSRNGDRV